MSFPSRSNMVYDETDEQDYQLGYSSHSHRENAASNYNLMAYPQSWSDNTYTNAQSSMTQLGPGIQTPSMQYVSWPAATYPQASSSIASQTPFYSARTADAQAADHLSAVWPNSPWPSLHPDDVETNSDSRRSTSPNPINLAEYGIMLSDGRSWRCAYPGCTSQARFIRGCDLRKHHRRHTKSLFCRYDDCPQSREGGFSSKKDQERHEQRHAPKITCTAEGCKRVFSRVDNMKDHVRRIHGAVPKRR